MDSERSELTDDDFLSGASVSESHESSHSSNFIATWPETHAQTYRYLQDAQLETKRAQLERYGAELEASVLEREVGLQADIREVNGSVNELRIEISNQETILSQIQETRNADILQIRKGLVNRLKKYESVMLETDRTITQLQEAIRAQSERWEKEKEVLVHDNMDEAAQADVMIGQLTREIETVRKQTIESNQKNEADLLDAEATIEYLQNEIRSIAGDSASTEGQFAQLTRELVGLKRQLIFAEAEGESVKALLDYNAKLRAQIKSVIDRTKQQQWSVTSRKLYVLE
jgi:hypothetical protein